MRYRKKPVVVEAMQLTSENVNSVRAWAASGSRKTLVGRDEEGRPFVTIQTLEGAMRATLGDYIIKGIKGEFYPCKPDIFEATYEQAD